MFGKLFTGAYYMEPEEPTSDSEKEMEPGCYQAELFDLEASGTNGISAEDAIFQDNEGEAYYEDDFEGEISDRIDVETNPELGGASSLNPEFEVEESAFGKKIRKRKKKMETRLLKEILNDVKISSKRH